MRILATVLAAASALHGCGRRGFDPAAVDGALDGALPDRPDPDGALPPDLVLYVPFEGDGVDVARGRAPTCRGCPLALSASPFGAGQAYALDGDDCLEYADDPDPRPGTFTLAAWIRASQARISSILGKAFDADTTEDNSFEFWVSDTGFLHFATVNGNAPYVFEPGFAPQTWYHVAGTFDGVTKRLYIDGTEREAGPASATMYDAEPFRIGCDRGMGGIGNYFIGALDDVRLYARALSVTEIAALAALRP